jgi:hypothetical protein
MKARLLDFPRTLLRALGSNSCRILAGLRAKQPVDFFAKRSTEASCAACCSTNNGTVIPKWTKTSAQPNPLRCRQTE